MSVVKPTPAPAPEVIEIKSIEDVQKAFDAMKKKLEEKGAENEKNFEEKIKALEEANAELKALKPEVTAKELKALKEDLDITLKAFDKLQVRLKENKIEPKKEEFKSFEQRIGEAMEKKTDDIAKFERKESKSLIIELKAVGDMSTANVTGGSRYGQIMQNGIIMNPNRKVHMQDILQSGNIGAGNTYTYMRENGQGEGEIKPVAEGATKSQFDLDLKEATVSVETIAGWLRVTRKAMNNIPGFISFIQQRLPEKFKKVLDQQILYGDGATPNLKGILTAGNFKASTAAIASVLAEKITTDIAVLEDTYERMATAVLLRPIDLAKFYMNKASGSGEYDLPNNVVFINGQLYISGVPVIASTAINTPDYLVGDFEQGAALLTQEAMRLEFFEQDGTNVRENKVTVRIEGNYALPVYGDDYFIKGTSATS
jgi:HK97 family phage major capsid protein